MINNLKIITMIFVLIVISLTLGCAACPPGPTPTPPIPTPPTTLPLVSIISKDTPTPPAEHPGASITSVTFKEDSHNWLGITATIRNTGDTILTGDTYVTIEGPIGSVLSKKLENSAIIQSMYLVPGKETPYENPVVFYVGDPGHYQIKVWVEDGNGKVLDTYYGDYRS